MLLNKRHYADILQHTNRKRWVSCLFTFGRNIHNGVGMQAVYFHTRHRSPLTRNLGGFNFMKVYTAEHIRNVALISHVGAGKTSLIDAALYDSGAVTRQGKVDEGSSIGDHDPDELKRRMTLHAKVLPVEWKNTKINFIDSPGYTDFMGEVKAALRVADAALVVVTAEKGVEVGTELTWNYADERNLPRMVLVNKLDRENTSFDQALESLRKQFGLKVVPLQLPIGEQAGFKGVVDLVRQKAYTFEGGNKIQEIPIPANL